MKWYHYFNDFVKENVSKFVLVAAICFVIFLIIVINGDYSAAAAKRLLIGSVIFNIYWIIALWGQFKWREEREKKEREKESTR
jgi:hypothetical protein